MHVRGCGGKFSFALLEDKRLKRRISLIVEVQNEGKPFLGQ